MSRDGGELSRTGWILVMTENHYGGQTNRKENISTGGKRNNRNTVHTVPYRCMFSTLYYF